MTKTAVVKLEGVYKTYPMEGGDLHILNNINLEIKKGEFVAIVGPSGSGKSTLMHVIGLLDRPTSGKVFLEEKAANHLSLEQQAKMRNTHIGFIFQVFNLLPKTSAVENVEMPLIYAGVGKKEREERAIAALKVVGLGERLWHLPSQLSGGQQQRVAIARALINHPSLILADEPTGNLDSKSGAEILKLLRDLNQEGNTIIIVTHDLEIAHQAERRIEIRDGVVIKDQKN